VQFVPDVARERARVRDRTAPRRVEGIAGERRTARGEVDADLVRPPGDELREDERAAARRVAREHAKARERRLAAGRGGVDEADRIVRHEPDRLARLERVRQIRGARDAEIELEGRAAAYLLRQGATRGGRRAEEDDAGRAAAEAMNRRRGAAFGRARAHEMKERALEEHPARQDGEPWRLVDREQIAGVVEHREGARHGGLAPRSATVLEAVAARERVVRRGGGAVSEDAPGGDPRAPRLLPRVRVAPAVELENALPGVARGDAIVVAPAAIEAPLGFLSLRRIHRGYPITQEMTTIPISAGAARSASDGGKS